MSAIYQAQQSGPRRLSRLERRGMSRKAQRYLSRLESVEAAAVAELRRFARARNRSAQMMEIALADIRALQERIDQEGAS